MSGSYLKFSVDYLEKYQKLNDTEFGRLVRAALRYKATGEETGNMGRESLLWDGMRLDIDRDNEAYADTVKFRSYAGKLGAAARWQNHSKNGKNSTCHFAILPLDDRKKENEKEEEKEESTKEEREEEKVKEKDNPSIVPPGGTGESIFAIRFKRLWEVYPRKVGKAQALKTFRKLNPSEKLLETMLSAIEAQKKSEQWTRDNGQFIPYLSTWLNRGQWDDVIDNMGTAINSQENDDISDIFSGGRKNDGSETDN